MTEEDLKDFVVKNLNEYFKSISDKQNLRKASKSLYISLTTPVKVEHYVQSTSPDSYIHHYNIKILNLFDPELELINTKPEIKNKLKVNFTVKSSDNISLRL